MAVGRPREYSEELLNKGREYLQNCKDEYKMITNSEVTQNKTIEGASFSETKETKTLKLRVNLPTIDGLAKYMNVNKSTIYEWIKLPEYIQFSNLYNELMEEQAERLINMSLSGEYNPAITKLLLTKHGYVEETKVDNETTISEIDKTSIIEALKDFKK